MLDALPFSEVWAVDFEFRPEDGVKDGGARPHPICLVAYELKSGRKLWLWKDEFGPFPPYSVGPNSLFLAYYASAEIGCHLVLGWPKPARILDLFTEWSEEERRAILQYCEQDVAALERLLPLMLRNIDVPRALLRGRYMAAAARMEFNGVPIDVPLLGKLRDRWGDIQDQLIADIDSYFGVFEGRTFKQDRFATLLVEKDIPWPRLDNGRLDLSDDTFRQMSKAHPVVAPLRELRSALSELRLEKLAVGPDGRNRCLLSAFQSRTGRNQPSNSRYIFGPSVWLRGLITPPPGYGLAYVDWSQQEFGIAASLSGDHAMMAAYRTGDPYLAFGKQAGAIPENATKLHPKRELFKQCVLAVQYGMEAEGLAARIGQPVVMARELLRMFRETFKTFWRWSNAVVDHAELHGSIETVFGWKVRSTANSNPRFHRNFLMQSTGAEMLRIACCLATERCIEICAPVHDAVLLTAPLDRLEKDVARMQEAMREASAAVLAGFELGIDVKIVRYPDRYMDPRGEVMWQRVMKLMGGADWHKPVVVSQDKREPA